MNKENLVISVKGLGKSFHYRKGLLRRATDKGIVQPDRLLRQSTSNNSSFWALRDISFDVSKGEILGIIGENGSGKTTLLKILAGITRPSEGSFLINGKATSILEIGSTFNQDFTGRQNIVYYGEILGMPKEGVKKAMNDIIAFSELENFIDMPVKTFSSGMKLRLAFSVISHLDFDVLLLDEVITVGDAAFQIKSYRKIRSLLAMGKTILVVSHVLEDILKICERTVYLKEGRIAAIGQTADVIKSYYLESSGSARDAGAVASKDPSAALLKWDDITAAPGNETIRILEIGIYSLRNNRNNVFSRDEALFLRARVHKSKDDIPLNMGFTVNHLGNNLFACSTMLDDNSRDRIREKGEHELVVDIPSNLFINSIYSIDFHITSQNNDIVLLLPHVLVFQVNDDGMDDMLRPTVKGLPGSIRPSVTYRLEHPERANGMNPE